MATRSPGWTSLLRLLRSLETEAQRQLSLFKDPNDAYSRRGFATAITMMKEFLESLYADRSDHIGQELEKAQNNSIIEGKQDDSAPSHTFSY